MLKIPDPNATLPTAATVLVVDDAASSRHLVAATLERLGFNTLKADDGRSALSVIRDFHPDAIVTDLEMPGMDGETMIEDLRNSEIEYCREIPIIVCSSKLDVETLVELNQLHVHAVVPKPVDVRALSFAALRYFSPV
ncbi:response regulator [Aporhodopirellula aestuarii]|uniref:Response regulator n=1 Tax=Aporhodopirellula aestuarii TaxID=2950107 RepID=A0ABT0TYM2_9BACT|nr:response regulator [Aporhodopirellula aestuarii]MCM2369665.1 response regulator [Aporhodopirellula aestuarii]